MCLCPGGWCRRGVGGEGYIIQILLPHICTWGRSAHTSSHQPGDLYDFITSGNWVQCSLMRDLWWISLQRLITSPVTGVVEGCDMIRHDMMSCVGVISIFTRHLTDGMFLIWRMFRFWCKKSRREEERRAALRRLIRYLYKCWGGGGWGGGWVIYSHVKNALMCSC